ncbi:MAG: hypothetical protein LBS74_10895 [Oscillospiraceae bacterium]|nr:hypothetical protein [Oscillospiraceae bacterium]
MKLHSKSKKILIVALSLMMTFALSGFGFAAWSQSVSINTSVSGSGYFQIDSAVSFSHPSKITTDPSSAVKTSPADHSTAYAITLRPLTAPTDWELIHVTVTNNSTVAAKLETGSLARALNVQINGANAITSVTGDALEFSAVDKPVVFSISNDLFGSAAALEELAVGESCSFDILASIPLAYTGTINPLDTYTLSFSLNYVQAPEAQTPTAGHTH